MKQRFSSLDVKVIAHELSNSLCSLRLANAYDLSSRIFLLKFAKPESRQQVLIDSGFRCHLTRFARTTAAAPSDFVARLRKYLKTRRVTAVSQVGTDRVIDFEFSDGQYRLFLEFYASGNIILTDKDLKILAVLRSVNDGPEHEHVRPGLQYSLDFRQNINGIPQLSKARLREALRDATEKQKDESAPMKKSRRKAGDQLRRALATSITEYPPMLVEHCLRLKNFDTTVLPETVLGDEKLLDGLLIALEAARRLVDEITSSTITTGYIITKPRRSAKEHAVAEESPYVYDDFHPFKPQQAEKDPACKIIEFAGYNNAVDEFFSSVEAQKLEGRLADREENAKRKLDAAKRDHEKRLGGLQDLQELNFRKAEAIQSNVERVEEATAAVNGLVAQGMDWVEIARLIELEQEKGNPVADLIHLPLKLYENTVTLLLGEAEAVDEEEDQGYETDEDVLDSDDEDQVTSKAQAESQKAKLLKVDIDLGLSPWANAREYFGNRRNAVEKEKRTLQSSEKALKSTERKVVADLKKGLKQEKAVLRPVRNQYWFEKFIYFISSDGYLVLGGKDATQNDILYKRHLKRGDAYVHADLPGAAPMVIKNISHVLSAPIPPSALSQAGTLSLATSNAWDSKAIMPAWWVYADQVSKVASTGDLLGLGQFSISGKKNFLPPSQLLLGFGVLFHISEESKANHTKHRFRDPMAKPDTTEVDEEARQMTAAVLAADKEEDEGEEAVESESDSEEEDFPDVGLDTMEEGDEKHHDHRRIRANPLQSILASNDKVQNQMRPARLKVEFQAPVIAEDKPSEPESSSEEEVGQDAQPEEASIVTESTTNTRIPIKEKPIPKQKAAQSKRGKRGKNKKVTTKYADQDDEDREQALQRLGTTVAKERAAEEAAQRAAKEAAAAAALARRREQQQRASKEGLEAEAQRRAKMESQIVPSDDDDDDMTLNAPSLDTLVGTCLPGDEILEALPVCAPWSAMARFKFKAKLQPGSTKKGKAVREILARWSLDENRKRVDEMAQDPERLWPRELELIRTWKDVEIMNTLPVSKVRVMMAGGSAGKAGEGRVRGGRGSGKKR